MRPARTDPSNRQLPSSDSLRISDALQSVDDGEVVLDVLYAPLASKAARKTNLREGMVPLS